MSYRYGWGDRPMGRQSSQKAAGGDWTDPFQDAQRRDHDETPEDIYVALMGVTGSGKSTFISRCTDQEVQVGHDLQACTQEVGVYDCKFSPSVTIKLVDTPGFDDTNRSDTEVLREIASWLTASYSSKIKLRGIIYLHRITDTRMQGSARKNLLMFKKLCGPDAMRNVILATTMWEQVDVNVGARREKELENTHEFWGWPISQGSRVKRLENNRESALRLLSIFVSTMQDCAVEIQTQMVDQGKRLTETAAGMELEQVLAKEREKFQKEVEALKQEMKEAAMAQDAETARELRYQKETMDREIQRNVQEQARLQSSLQEEHDRNMAQLQEALQAAQVARLHAEAQQARNEQALRDELKARSQQDEKYKREVELIRQKLEAAQTQQPTPSNEKSSDKYPSHEDLSRKDPSYEDPSDEDPSDEDSAEKDSSAKDASAVVYFCRASSPKIPLRKPSSHRDSSHKDSSSKDSSSKDSSSKDSSSKDSSSKDSSSKDSSGEDSVGQDVYYVNPQYINQHYINQIHANQFYANRFYANQFYANQFPANQFPANQFLANQFSANQFPAFQNHTNLFWANSYGYFPH